MSHTDLTDCGPLLPCSLWNARDSHGCSRRFSCCAVQDAGSGSGGIVRCNSTDNTRKLEHGTALVSAPPMVPCGYDLLQTTAAAAPVNVQLRVNEERLRTTPYDMR